MINAVTIVGRIMSDPEVTNLDNGEKVTNVTLAIPRSYKNNEGVYEADLLNCELQKGIASAVADYCRKGDVVGVKGKLKTNSYETKDGNKYNSVVVEAEKFTFISSIDKIKKQDQER